MNVLVVESPAKAKTINKYLGPGYKVLASFGHIRDLPSKDGSVKPDDDFSMIWEVDARAQKRIKDIANAVKGADKLILATDPDREGEAISWHVLEVLKQKNALGGIQVERVVFNAITKSADPRGHRPSPRNPRRTGRCLSGAPRSRLSRRLHALARAVAQTARRAFRRPRAIGRAAAGLRTRSTKSKRSGRRNTGASMPTCRRTGGNFSARLTHLDGKKLDKIVAQERGRCATRRRRDQGARSSRSAGREQAGQAQPLPALHHFDAAAGSLAQARLRRQAHHAGRAATL